MEVLEIRKVSKHFGGLIAIDGIDLAVGEYEIRGIIGPNGAGKTTLFNIITGFFLPTKGEVIFKGKDITKLPVHARVKRGIARTFQQANLFMDSTVYQNVYAGYHHNYKAGPIKQFFHTSAARGEEEICIQRTIEILEFMGLISLKDELAQKLSYGHQRILGVCIALNTRPVLLLLDEPVAGMNAEETMAMMKLIRKIRDRGVAILVVEHDMTVIMNLCERVTVLNYGRKIAEGSPEEVREDENVVEAYLGRGEE